MLADLYKTTTSNLLYLWSILVHAHIEFMYNVWTKLVISYIFIRVNYKNGNKLHLIQFYIDCFVGTIVGILLVDL